MPASDAIVTSGSASYWVDDRRKLVRHPTRGDFRVSKTQFAILLFLHRHRGQVFSQADIIREVWDATPHTERRIDNVRVQIQGLRRKVGDDVIDTVHGYGYAVGYEGNHE